MLPDELDPLSCDDPTIPPAGGPGWGLTPEEIAANVRDWYADLAASVEPWPTDAEIAEYEHQQRRT